MLYVLTITVPVRFSAPENQNEFKKSSVQDKPDLSQVLKNKQSSIKIFKIITI